MRTLEDAVWTYFGYPNEHWTDKCSNCRKKVIEEKLPASLVPECINCWKIEIWSQSPWLMQFGLSSTDPGFLFGLACKLALALDTGGSFVAKLSKYPIQVVRSGEPLNQYPKAATDRLLMVYASSISERDELLQAICRALGISHLLGPNIPVRRGCWLYDGFLGPWQEWYQIDKDSML